VVRQEIVALHCLGRLYDEHWLVENASVDLPQRCEELLKSFHPPVTDEEACVLNALLPDDGSSTFGFAWSLLHLIETAPGWPINSCMDKTESWWINFLRERAQRGGRLAS
jgi:hypothetical protein